MKQGSVKSLFHSIGTVLSKHSPAILTGIGIAGMVASTVLAVKATPKALRILEEEKPESKVDAVKAAWKPYIPAAITCTVSIACIIGAGKINAKRFAALGAAYSLSDTAFREYKGKVAEIFGEKKEREVRDAVAKDTLDKAQKNHEVVISGTKCLCYDGISGRYFQSDMEQLRKVENILNHRLLSEMYISLNEFYHEIGIREIDIGEDIGWNIDDGEIEMLFSSQLAEDGTPCLVVSYTVGPRYDYRSLR